MATLNSGLKKKVGDNLLELTYVVHLTYKSLKFQREQVGDNVRL